MKTLSAIVGCVALCLGVGAVAYGAGNQNGETTGRREAQELIARGELPVSSHPDAPVVSFSAAKGRGHGWALRCRNWEPVDVKGPVERHDRSHYIDCPG